MELDATISKNVWLLHSEATHVSAKPVEKIPEGIFAVGKELRRVQWYNRILFFLQDVFTGGASKTARDQALQHTVQSTLNEVNTFVTNLAAQRHIDKWQLVVKPKEPTSCWPLTRMAHNYREVAQLKDITSECGKIGIKNLNQYQIAQTIENIIATHQISVPETVGDM